MVCSFVRTKKYNPRRSLIKIFKIENEGVSIPMIDCDGESCPTPDGFPKCVDLCPTGALMYTTLEEAVKRRRELVLKKG